MSYQVLARRWRPQSLDQLVGQNHIRQTLRNALERNRLHHALLLTGPRGTGKTSTARILAKALRCPNVQNFEPCHQCSECTEIAAGRSVNVIEIDGASNNGVDAIRDLRDSVNYLPSSGSRKVYIIDEVHMLSNSAFNALLKTLEEPPDHVTFVFATTEVHKIPNTILSRCQRFDFRLINLGLIVDQLKKICEADQIPFEEEALWGIARQSGGSMRDSQSLLEQVMTFSGMSVTVAQTNEILGLTDRRLISGLLEAFLKRDPKEVLSLIHQLHQAGIEPRIFISDILLWIRNALLLKLSPQEARSLIELPELEVQQLQTLADGFTAENLHILFDMALKGAHDLPKSMEPWLVLEVLLMRMCEAPRLLALADVTSSAKTARAPHENHAQPTPTAALQIKTSVQPPSSSAERWRQLVLQIKSINGLIGAQLENCSLEAIKEQTLYLTVPTKLKFIFDKVNEPQFKRKVANYASTFWGQPYEVSVALASDNQTVVTPKAVEEQETVRRRQAAREEVENHPAVQSAKRYFNLELTSIKENPK